MRGIERPEADAEQNRGRKKRPKYAITGGKDACRRVTAKHVHVHLAGRWTTMRKWKRKRRRRGRRRRGGGRRGEANEEGRNVRGENMRKEEQPNIHNG